MTRFIVLSLAGEGDDSPYGLRLGPLRFTTALSDVTEPLGDGLSAVGAQLVAGERAARKFEMRLPVRGDYSEPDMREVGRRLRRQSRALLENRAWLKHPLPLTWDVDPDLDLWLLVGGGDLSEIEDGLTFGEFDLSLSDCYIVGRPGTHRAGRRIDLADRRNGLVPRTTFGLVYSTDYADTDLPAAPAFIPGDVTILLGAGGEPATVENGPVDAVTGRRLWRAVSAADGEVLTFTPDAAILPAAHGRHWQLDAPGSVTAWLPDPVDPAPDPADERPDLLYGWERVYGPLSDATVPVAIQNGMTRCVWLGSSPLTGGWRIDGWRAGEGYIPVVRIAPPGGAAEHSIIELTPERVVLETLTVPARMRLVLQRGWTGPRVEVAAPGGAPTLTMHPADPDDETMTSEAAGEPVTDILAGEVIARAAHSHASVEYDDTPAAGIAEWTDPAGLALAVQLSTGDALLTGEQLAALSLIDARSVPVLVER